MSEEYVKAVRIKENLDLVDEREIGARTRADLAPQRPLQLTVQD